METTNNTEVMDNVRRARSARPLPWEIIGTSFKNEDITIQEAIEKAKADYAVEQSPIVRVSKDVFDQIREDGAGNVLLTRENLILGYKANYRSDNGTNLGVVTDKYGVVQNTKAFDVLSFLEEVSGIKPIIDNVGVLDGGARIYVSCRFGEDYDLGNGDIVKNYVVFTNTHDGSGSVMCFFTPIRVWCKNTLNFAIRKTKNKLTYPHTINVNARLDFMDAVNRDFATNILTESIAFGKQFREAMERMKSKEITAQEMSDFAARIYLTDANYKLYEENGNKLEGKATIPTVSKNNVRALMDAIESGVGQEAHRGTRLWLYNGLTTYLHNDRQYESAESEFKSVMEGNAKRKVQMAFDLLTA